MGTELNTVEAPIAGERGRIHVVQGEILASRASDTQTPSLLPGGTQAWAPLVVTPWGSLRPPSPSPRPCGLCRWRKLGPVSLGHDPSLWLFFADTPLTGDERSPSTLVWGGKWALAQVNLNDILLLKFQDRI